VPTTPQESSIHKHAFWLYGVLVGIAIKEALEIGVAHLVNPERLLAETKLLALPFRFPDNEVGLAPEIIRLTVFLVLIVRFYFGSAFFFGAAYESPSAKIKFPITNYAADFIFGFFHFIAFVILALLIDIHTTPIHHFPYLVAFILIYDVLWYAASFRRSTVKMIFFWMAVNLVTALTAALTYVIIESHYQDVLRAERCAAWIVLVVSVIDIGLMMAKRPFFQPLGKWVPRDDILEPPPQTPDETHPIPE
jgi:hypothetical protein